MKDEWLLSNHSSFIPHPSSLRKARRFGRVHMPQRLVDRRVRRLLGVADGLLNLVVGLLAQFAVLVLGEDALVRQVGLEAVDRVFFGPLLDLLARAVAAVVVGGG